MSKEQNKMDEITTKMAEHICDKLCKYPLMKFEGDECLEDICCECEIGQFICDIQNTYNRLNEDVKEVHHENH